MNANTQMDKYFMKYVNEYIGEIGCSGSIIFTTINLTAGFWQLLLHTRVRPYTAFTVPRQGHYQWVTTLRRLLRALASFQSLIEIMVHSLSNVIVYIGDLLLHSMTHSEHTNELNALFHHLIQHGIKINLRKCKFSSKEVPYLGFCLTKAGILHGNNKFKAVQDTPPPTNVHKVCQFLSLCNFFCAHVQNFAQILSALTALTKKECQLKG
jgi:hypothetical protein